MAEMDHTVVLEGLTSYWNDRAHSYSAQNVEEMSDWRREVWKNLILENAPVREKLRILDVGCGPGFFAMVLSLAGHQVTAIDVTQHMLQHAKMNADAYGAEVTFLLNRGEKLPFKEETFDLIVSRNVLWNLEYPKQALLEWKRVLAPGGRMVYFDANWYLYLFDQNLREFRDNHRKAFYAKHHELNDSGNLGAERVKDLERIAYDLPLSREHRPEWDRTMLENIGMTVVKIQEKVGTRVQLLEEFERDLPTPVFMICAQKKGMND